MISATASREMRTAPSTASSASRLCGGTVGMRNCPVCTSPTPSRNGLHGGLNGDLELRGDSLGQDNLDGVISDLLDRNVDVNGVRIEFRKGGTQQRVHDLGGGHGAVH